MPQSNAQDIYSKLTAAKTAQEILETLTKVRELLKLNRTDMVNAGLNVRTVNSSLGQAVDELKQWQQWQKDFEKMKF